MTTDDTSNAVTKLTSYLVNSISAVLPSGFTVRLRRDNEIEFNAGSSLYAAHRVELVGATREELLNSAQAEVWNILETAQDLVISKLHGCWPGPQEAPADRCPKAEVRLSPSGELHAGYALEGSWVVKLPTHILGLQSDAG